MKQTMNRLLILCLTLLVLCGCGAVSSSDSSSAAPEVPALSDDEIVKMYEKALPYLNQNFYAASPYRDLEPDHSQAMDENFAFPAGKYKTMAEFRSHLISDYSLSESFADRLLGTVSFLLYEKEGQLYIVEADGQLDQTVGNEIGREIIRQSDTKVILRVTRERVDETGDQPVVTGSLDTDYVFVYQDGKWVIDDFPAY